VAVACAHRQRETQPFEARTLTRRAQAALISTYLLCELLNNGAFVINFVLVSLLQAAEFWFVKVRRLFSRLLLFCHSRAPQNVAGRKLIGLRYWNYTNEAGENEWQFECRDAEGMALLVPDEKRMFWATLYVTPVLWALFSLVSLLKLSLGYLMLCLMGLCLSGTNVIGFTKSSKEAKAEINAGVSRFATQYMRSSILG